MLVTISVTFLFLLCSIFDHFLDHNFGYGLLNSLVMFSFKFLFGYGLLNSLVTVSVMGLPNILVTFSVKFLFGYGLPNI